MLKELQKRGDFDIRFWTDRAFFKQASAKIHDVDPKIRISVLHSGKIRRYHSLPLWRQLLRWRTIVGPNLRDGFLLGLGVVESFFRLLGWRPDVIFLKGGYVCLTVGLAARVLNIPFVLHDSDTHPGLANRMLARWAAHIGTGAELKYYPYSTHQARYVGIPVDPAFRAFSRSERAAMKKKQGFAADTPLVVVTGGGLGAQSINAAIVASLPVLLEATSVLLICGQANYADLKPKLADYKTSRFQLHAFIDHDMAAVLGAADVVVARAGATTLLELATLARPTILVPNPYLTAGHQLTNAKQYSNGGAAMIVDEKAMVADSSSLSQPILELVRDPQRQATMSKAIAQFATPHAAHDMAELILAAADHVKSGTIK